MNVILQIACFLLNVALGKYQAYRFDVEQRRINHTVWASLYLLVATQVFWPTHNWFVVGACWLQHLPVFNTALNFSRKVQKPFWEQLFYTHPADPLGSKLDQFWGKAYPLVFFLSLAALIIIQFFIK